MKWSAYIFALWVLMLSTLPCADEFENTHVGEAELAVAQSAGNEHQHGEEADLCGPFCICVCCGAVISSFHGIANFFQTTHYGNTEFHAFYHHTMITRYLPEHWQPPKTA